MKEKWGEKYKGVRVIMWDNTNVYFGFQPGGTDEQRLTYSMYYAGNCAKGGVFLQLCGLTGVEHLWVGATRDSHYHKHKDIFRKQHHFAIEDKVDRKHILFTNIFDKGYMVNLPAYRAGRQQVIQPIFTKSDQKFTGKETIQSASFTTNSSGNERAVNCSKLAGYIKRGLIKRASPKLIDKTWLAWLFQRNS